jgi:hypothetical protein
MLLELLYNYHGGVKMKYMNFGHTSVIVDILFKY